MHDQYEVELNINYRVIKIKNFNVFKLYKK